MGKLSWLVIVTFSVVGCNAGQNLNCRQQPIKKPMPVLADREAVARVLPSGITLSTPVQADGYAGIPGPRLERILAEAGARVGEDGRLYDRDGKEFYFDTNDEPPPVEEHYNGWEPDPKVLEAKREERRKFLKRYHEIIIDTPGRQQSRRFA